MGRTLPLRHCKRVIATVWFVGAGVPFVLLVVQDLLQHYGPASGEIWSWFIGAVSPTLGLIVAVLAAEAVQAKPDARPVDAFFYRLALAISTLYLVSLSFIILSEPLQQPPGGLPQIVRESGAWVAALQGLVTASLGAFYVRRG